jgi:hypothetical protein
VEGNRREQRDAERDQEPERAGQQETGRPVHPVPRERVRALPALGPERDRRAVDRLRPGVLRVDRGGHARLEGAQAQHVAHAAARRHASGQHAREQEDPGHAAERAAQAGHGLEEDRACRSQRERGKATKISGAT